jgi:carotenoid cleavage dioxygenase
MTRTENPFLAGNYGPVPDETTSFDLPTDGAVPADLNGRYLRIGPNPYAPPQGEYHWFLGDGMVHGVELRDGKANWYRNRWVRTATITAARNETPTPGPKPPMYDASNTHVIGHAGRILSLTEGSMPYELSKDLDTISRCDFGGPLPTGFTAHPKIDPVTGELHGFAYWWAEPYLTYHVIDATGRLVRSVPITVKGPTMIHDFSVTREHVVFYDLPVVFDLERLPFPYRWDDDYGARVGVMPRDGGDDDVRWFDVEPCYVFHPMNAYDDGDTVILDVVRHETMFKHSTIGPNDQQVPTLDRWTVDLSAGKVREERLDDRGQEFPRVNDTLAMSRHRFGYSVESVNTDDAFTTARILKHDLDRGATAAHDFGAGHMPGEFVFVPRAEPTNGAEDDGWLMGYVYDAARDTSDLVVLDALDVAGAPVATVHLPRRVPFGFHGSWIED